MSQRFSHAHPKGKKGVSLIVARCVTNSGTNVINSDVLQRRGKMALKVEVAVREFVFDGHTLPDPDSSMSVERVREMYMPSHPEITTAEVVGPEFVDGKMRYTFNRAIGHKG